MKKIFLAICSVFVIVISAQAQNVVPARQTKNESIDKYQQIQNDNIDKALKAVGASVDQAVQFKKFHKEFDSKTSQVLKDATIDDRTRETRLEEVETEKNTKLSGIIGAEKYNAFEKIRREQKGAEAELSPNKG